MNELYLEEFEPTGKKYWFTDYETLFPINYFCYKTKNGICSFDIKKGDAICPLDDKHEKTADFNYCINFYNSILKQGQKSPIYIARHACNHYSVYNGRHRICIASKKGLKLNAYVKEINEICDSCSKENQLQSSISYLENLINMTTAKNTIFHKIFKIETRSPHQDELDIKKKALIDLQLINKSNLKEF